MFQPVPMAKVAIVGAKPRLPETIETLHRLNLLHIEDFAGSQDDAFDLGSPLPNGSKVSERLLRVRGVLKGAQMAPPPTAKSFTVENLNALEGRLREVEDDVARLVEERSKVQDEAKGLQEQATLLNRILNFPTATRLLTGYRSLASAAGFVSAEADLGSLKAAHPDAEWMESVEAEGRFIVVFVPKAAERALQDALSKLSFQPMEVPSFEAPPRDMLATLEARRTQLEARLAQLDEKLAAIRERHASAFFALDEHLSIEADKATAPVRFRTTANSFMIEGWIPHDAYTKLESSLARATKNGVFLTRLQRAATSHEPTKHAKPDAHAEHHGDDAHVEENVPVKLKNPNRAGPYELLTDTYSRPKYNELDPTLFMYIGFPFFFGMMLGDIGYGIVLFALVAFGVFNKVYKVFGFQSQWHLNRIFLHCAVSSILFGLLYAEFFGLELWGAHGLLSHAEAHLGPIPWPLARLEYVKLLLALSLLIGVVHLFIGLVLGMRNAAAEHGMADAIKHRGSWLCILLAVTLAGIAIVPDTLHLNESPAHEEPAGAADPAAEAHEEKIIAHPQPLYYASLALLAVGIVLLVMGEGGIALLELPTVLSNLLSYTRLVAIGLSGVGIALAGNKVAAGMIGGSIPGGAVAGIITAILFHLMGVALGVLGPALHALRLHYVEFFTKFYTGGGTPYAPFGAQRKYTIQEVKQA